VRGLDGADDSRSKFLSHASGGDTDATMF